MKKAVLALVFAAMLFTACKGEEKSEPQSASSITSVSEESSSDNDNEIARKTAAEYAAAALSAAEFPTMEDLSGEDKKLKIVLDLDASRYEDYAAHQNVISTRLNYVIVVKPKDGARGEVFAEIKAWFDNVVKNGAAYPEQEESVAGAVMGETPDGFIYAVIHKDGAQCAQAIRALS